MWTRSISIKLVDSLIRIDMTMMAHRNDMDLAEPIYIYLCSVVFKHVLNDWEFISTNWQIDKTSKKCNCNNETKKYRKRKKANDGDSYLILNYCIGWDA